MSSPSPIWSERVRPVRAAAAALALIATQVFLAMPAHAAPVPLPVASVVSAGGKTTLVVDLSAASRAGKDATVTLDGADQPATLTPVLSAGLALSLVADTSKASEASLPAWLSGAARFILEAPATTDAVMIGDSVPAKVIVGPQRGALEVVRGLDKVAAQGPRDTAAALKLAAAQFPAAAAGRRVVVYYTAAPDAGGISAAALAAEYRATQTMLVVVGTADTSSYWSRATAPTGGFFAPAGNPVVVPALDQVQTQLDSRYLVQFATPPARPATVSVTVHTADLTLAGDVAVPGPDPAVAESSAADAGDSTGSGLRTGLLWGAIAVVLLALLAGVFVLLRKRSDPPSPPGRAAVPQPRAQGRATIPGTPSADEGDDRSSARG
jgi:hypothetical protein